MGAEAARTELLEQFKTLYIVPKFGTTVWRTTTRGTAWVMLGWKSGLPGVRYSLHVHGKLTGPDNGTPTMADMKIRSQDLKEEIFLSGVQATQVWSTVKNVIQTRKFS